MWLERSSGILLHPTSLPRGTLGDEAFAFIDWLAAARQSWWAVLPLGPPDEYHSPYAARSAFAGSSALLAEPSARVTAEELEEFVARQPYWIADWAAHAGAGAVADQVRFEREWSALRRYAARKGIRVFGDLPLYVSGGGADHRAHPELFQEGAVAGAPPDAFSKTGQHWGNPLYDWHAHRVEGYRWWTERFRRTFALVDAVRIDHFRGFSAYWAVPAGHKTAKHGRWRRGPGRAPFDAASSALGELRLVAEDLGVITPAVYRLRDELGLPGMVVLHWGFGGGASNPHRIENHRKNLVVYTGTHDTDTTAGWFAALRPRERERTGLDAREPHWSLIDLAMHSPAALAIVPAQDVIGLGSEARMNLPGTTKGNWTWRLREGELTDDSAARLREATERGNRVSSPARRK